VLKNISYVKSERVVDFVNFTFIITINIVIIIVSVFELVEKKIFLVAIKYFFSWNIGFDFS